MLLLFRGRLPTVDGVPLHSVAMHGVAMHGVAMDGQWWPLYHLLYLNHLQNTCLWTGVGRLHNNPVPPAFLAKEGVGSCAACCQLVRCVVCSHFLCACCLFCWSLSFICPFKAFLGLLLVYTPLCFAFLLCCYFKNDIGQLYSETRYVM